MKYYDSADSLPIWNYWNITTKSDISYLLKEGELSGFMPQREKQLIELSKAWEKITDEMNDVFIKDPDFVSALIEEKDYIYKIIDAVIDPNPLNKFKAKVAKESFTKSPTFDYETSIAILEKYLGYGIDDRKMSVKRYYTHLRLMKSHNKPSVK